MAIRSLGNSTSPYDAVMGTTGRNTGATDYDPPPPLGYGARGVIAGGGIQYGGGNPLTDQMQYITIATTGNATNFGDLLTGNHNGGSCSPGVYGYFIGGDSTPYTPNNSNVIQRITIQTTGNSTDVGDLTFLRNSNSGAANDSRGISAGGQSVWPYNNDGNLNQIEYFDAAGGGGDSSDFGDLATRVQQASGMSGQ